MQGEAPRAGVEAAASSPGDRAEMMNEGGYTKLQISYADETILYWKKMPPGTLIAIEEKSVPDLKLQMIG